MKASEEALARLEVQVGRLLHAGVFVSAGCLAAGLLLTLMRIAAPAQHVLLTAGLVVLMATPILRVIVSMVEYARMRDWFFVVTTLIVLGVLAGSVIAAVLGF
jgi:uncharacterized membrane protein